MNLNLENAYPEQKPTTRLNAEVEIEMNSPLRTNVRSFSFSRTDEKCSNVYERRNDGGNWKISVSYTHLTLPTTPYV